jgi:hypothetical protein
MANIDFSAQDVGGPSNRHHAFLHSIGENEAANLE